MDDKEIEQAQEIISLIKEDIYNVDRPSNLIIRELVLVIKYLTQ